MSKIYTQQLIKDVLNKMLPIANHEYSVKNYNNGL